MLIHLCSKHVKSLIAAVVLIAVTVCGAILAVQWIDGSNIELIWRYDVVRDNWLGWTLFSGEEIETDLVW